MLFRSASPPAPPARERGKSVLRGSLIAHSPYLNRAQGMSHQLLLCTRQVRGTQHPVLLRQCAPSPPLHSPAYHAGSTALVRASALRVLRVLCTTSTLGARPPQAAAGAPICSRYRWVSAEPACQVTGWYLLRYRPWARYLAAYPLPPASPAAPRPVPVGRFPLLAPSPPSGAPRRHATNSAPTLAGVLHA